jgi:hypothetical protein
MQWFRRNVAGTRARAVDLFPPHYGRTTFGPVRSLKESHSLRRQRRTKRRIVLGPYTLFTVDGSHQEYGMNFSMKATLDLVGTRSRARSTAWFGIRDFAATC